MKRSKCSCVERYVSAWRYLTESEANGGRRRLHSAPPQQIDIMFLKLAEAAGNARGVPNGGDSRRNQDGGKVLRTFCTMVFMKEIDKNALGGKSHWQTDFFSVIGYCVKAFGPELVLTGTPLSGANRDSSGSMTACSQWVVRMNCTRSTLDQTAFPFNLSSFTYLYNNTIN